MPSRKTSASVAAVAAFALLAAASSGARSRPAEPSTLAQALQVSHRVGPVAPRTRIHLLLALRGGDLAAVLRTGAPVGGPLRSDGALVRPALAFVRRAGLRVEWSAGDVTASTDGSARAVDSLLHVRIDAYVTPGGRRFYAGDRAPTLSRVPRRAVTGIAGLDDFGRVQPQAVTPGGVTPSDVLSFYDIQPLRAAGLTGAGETIVFPELAGPADSDQLRQDVADFASRFHLPPFDLTIRNNDAWHASSKQSAEALGEADLDLEVVHAIAPGAKLVVYEGGGGWTDLAALQTAMQREHPTAIISESLGGCELAIADTASELNAIATPWAHEAAQNMTHFVSSGNSGAYQCDESHPAATSFPADLPVVTAVGGTSVLLAQGGGYWRELAWGNPLSQSGGGGGATRIFARPTFQTGPGVPAGKARLVPDVSGLADENTGWNIVTSGQSQMIGGTSAAAPLWAGIAALVDEDLAKRKLPPIGAADTALYTFGREPGTYHAFHDVTAGNNLLYVARPGWDEATGWGTPDAARLDAAFRAYEAAHRAK